MFFLILVFIQFAVLFTGIYPFNLVLVFLPISIRHNGSQFVFPVTKNDIIENIMN